MYTTDICNTKEMRVAQISFVFVKNPRVNMESRMLRQLNEWKSWLQASTIKQAVRALSRPSFSTCNTSQNARRLQNAMNVPCAMIRTPILRVTTDSFFKRGG